MTTPSVEGTFEKDWDEESEIAHFPAGIPGFEEHKHYFITSKYSMRPFLWLRSVDDPQVALPIISCLLLQTNDLLKVTTHHLKLVDAESESELAPYYVIRVDPKEGLMTANTKAPLIISDSSKKGYQIFLENNLVRVDEPLMNLLPPQDEG